MGHILKNQLLAYREVSFKHNTQLSFPFEMNLKTELNASWSLGSPVGTLKNAIKIKKSRNMCICGGS